MAFDMPENKRISQNPFALLKSAVLRFLTHISKAAQQERARFILWIPILLAIGMGSYFSLNFEPPAPLLYAPAIFSLALWSLMWPWRHQDGGAYLSWLIAGICSFVLIGGAAAKWRTDHVAAPVLAKEMRITNVQGRVIDIDYLAAGQGYRLLLDDLTIENLPASRTPYSVRLRVRTGSHEADGQDTDGEKKKYNASLDYVVPPIGARVRVLAGLNPPSAPVAPGAFDFQRYAWFKKIGAFGFSYKAPEVIVPPEKSDYATFLAGLRAAITRNIHETLQPAQAAIAAAFMAGERSGIREDDVEAMRDSGLAHMLAISGLHVGLVAGIVFMAVRYLMALVPFLALRYPIKKYAAFLAMLVSLFYMLLVGAPVSTVRAMIMTGIVLTAVMLDRVAISMRLVALAAAAVLLIKPEALLGAGFQMSFAAVAALVFFYDRTRHLWADAYRQAGILRRMILYFVGVTATTIVATLATAPFSLFHFQQLALYSLLANFMAVPILTFIVMPAAVLAMAVMPLGFADWPLMVAGYAIDWILSIAHGVADISFSTWTPAAWPVGALMMFSGAALFAMIWQGRGRYLALIPIILSFVIIYQYKQPDILVSSSGKLIALRQDSGVYQVSSRRSDRFTAEIWARRNGQDPEDIKRWPRNEAESRCDEWGCHAVLRGYKIAMPYHAAAYRDDCEWADIVISREAISHNACPAPLSIDFFDLYYKGGHALWLPAEQARPGHTDKTPAAAIKNIVKIEHVAAMRGTRPWAKIHRR